MHATATARVPGRAGRFTRNVFRDRQHLHVSAASRASPARRMHWHVRCGVLHS